MLDKLIIQRTLRVPASTGAAGDGTAVARQLDAALLDVGFAASRALLDHIGALAPAPAMDLAATVVSAVRELVGDHVQHNAYFIGFPDDVPDTVEFWVDRLRAAVLTGGGTATDAQLRDAVASGGVNLLDLPGYGTYQHTYAELLAAHDDLIRAVGDRVTLLRLGDVAEVEAERLYLALAGRSTPLGETDLALLGELTVACVDGAQPAEIPVRGNRAVLNGVRLVLGRPLVGMDTTTDVLRLACQASGGDVSLVTPTRFRSFRRPERRMLLAALDAVVGASPAKLGDVARYAERWKRLGERLHPHEYDQWPHAREVFAVARGERRVPSLAGRAEAAIRAGAVGPAAAVLSAAPGLLLRSADRLLRLASASERSEVVGAVTAAFGSASGRVLLSLREHVDNRLTPASARMYASRSRTAWVGPDERPPLPADLVAELSRLLDDAVAARLPDPQRPLLVDPEVLDVALPLSGKATEAGFAVLPRGSRAPVSGELLRFFTFWRQTSRRTDYDLSVLLLDADFHSAGQVSWTNYHHDGVVHSGDVTDATHGATEFIDVPLADRGHYVVPQVNIYAGESFDQVAESMFGYQTRDRDQRGAPFDARTVRARSQLRGPGRVALPVVFARTERGWQAVWLHLYLRGWPVFNRVEGNTFTTADRVRALMERRYLTVSYLVDRWRTRAEVRTWDGRLPDEPVTFVGIDAPEGLPDGSEAYTLDRLSELIPG
ncbi:TerD family protein [Micromonospora sp. NBS 11-29]|uniref:TerD family protein n=1 Tax=Micromonospora sp. NBS 11-29 TaxID=1960879 RepID=UPI000B7799F6|nr:TerD family protein [Micromonospora sp. NBS 11-29]